jgi:hypothetical protein
MYIPNIGQPSFAQLYSSYPPVKVKIHKKIDTNIYNITVYNNHDNSINDNRDIDVSKNGIRFFDVPSYSKYYYAIIELRNNSYDALDVNDVSYFMALDEAMDESDRLNIVNPSDHEVVIRKI